METTDIQKRIITESGRLFALYGIRSMTMDALAEDMGISKRTIYENFKDKDTLLLNVIVFYKEEQQKLANEIISKAENAIVALFELVNGMINIMKQVNPVFFHDIKKYHSEIFNQMSDKGDIRDHTMTCEIIKQGRAQDIFRTDFNLEIVVSTIHELFNLFSPNSKLTRDGYHRAELFNNIIIPYFIGISTEKGKTLMEEQGLFKF
ncbi:MAG: TetR/AcrR family transcriptional regulator [Bacteroidales bacterium]|jgi:AcrR family transcriptional regulator|nr:TetR/AcrR family transcriptional regulator [Bacteroidales bacterium]